MVNEAVELADDARLAEVVRRLVTALQPERIYLFGSRARGEGTPESDYDVLVVVSQTPEEPYHLERQAYSALVGLATPVDVMVMSRERFERRRMVAASLPATVEREGKLLYVSEAATYTSCQGGSTMQDIVDPAAPQSEDGPTTWVEERLKALSAWGVDLSLTQSALARTPDERLDLLLGILALKEDEEEIEVAP